MLQSKSRETVQRFGPKPDTSARITSPTTPAGVSQLLLLEVNRPATLTVGDQGILPGVAPGHAPRQAWGKGTYLGWQRGDVGGLPAIRPLVPDAE